MRRPGRLAADLGRCRAGQPIVARPIGHVEHTRRWCSRNPLAAGLVGAVAASLVLGLLAALMFETNFVVSSASFLVVSAFIVTLSAIIFSSWDRINRWISRGAGFLARLFKSQK